jgi:hypothetical protein
MGTLSFEPTGCPLGAFVCGLDFDDIDGRALRDALTECRLLCIRGRVVTGDEHTALASSLGYLAAERAGVISLVSNVVPGGARAVTRQAGTAADRRDPAAAAGRQRRPAPRAVRPSVPAGIPKG